VCEKLWSGGGNIFPQRAEEGWGRRPSEQHQEKMFSAGPLYIGDPPLQSSALQDHRITDVSASAGEAEANPTQNLTFPKKREKMKVERGTLEFSARQEGSPPAASHKQKKRPLEGRLNATKKGVKDG